MGATLAMHYKTGFYQYAGAFWKLLNGRVKNFKL